MSITGFPNGSGGGSGGSNTQELNELIGKTGVIFTDNTTIVNANSEVTFTLTTQRQQSTNLQIAIEPSNGAIGTVAISVLPLGKTTFEVLYNEFQTAKVVDLASAKVFQINAVVSAVKFTPTISNGSFSVALVGFV